MGAPTRGLGSFLLFRELAGPLRVTGSKQPQRRAKKTDAQLTTPVTSWDLGPETQAFHRLPGPPSLICPPQSLLSTSIPVFVCYLSVRISFPVLLSVYPSLSSSLSPVSLLCLSICLSMSLCICLSPPVCVCVTPSLSMHLSVSLSPCLCPSLSRSLKPETDSLHLPAATSTSWFLRKQGRGTIAEVPSWAPRLGRGGQGTCGGHITATL